MCPITDELLDMSVLQESENHQTDGGSCCSLQQAKRRGRERRIEGGEETPGRDAVVRRSDRIRDRDAL